MQLAESMEARGFGGQVVPASSRQRTLNQLALLVGLGALGVGFAGIGFWPEKRLLAGVLLAAGLALLGWSFWDQGRRVHRTRYHRWVWARPDRIIGRGQPAVARRSGWAPCWFAASGCSTIRTRPTRRGRPFSRCWGWRLCCWRCRLLLQSAVMRDVRNGSKELRSYRAW